MIEFIGVQLSGTYENIFVNINQIVAIEPAGEKTTQVTLTTCGKKLVNESIDSLYARIYARIK